MGHWIQNMQIHESFSSSSSSSSSSSPSPSSYLSITQSYSPAIKNRLRARWSRTLTPKVWPLIQLPDLDWLGNIKGTGNQNLYFSSKIQDGQKQNRQRKTKYSDSIRISSRPQNIADCSWERKFGSRRGAWMARSVKCPTSAQVTISRFMGLSPVSSSVLTARSLRPALDSVSPSLSLSLSLCSSLVLSPSLSKINKH